jgi:hypothetical protein
MTRPTPTTRLHVDALDDRIVPAATWINLTAPGAEAAAGGGLVRQQATVEGGQRNLDTFVRLHSNRGLTEQGYNSNARPVQFDEVSSRKNNHAIRLDQVPTVTVAGQQYREFVLDVNQPRWNPYIALQEVRVYTSENPNLRGYNAATKQLGGQTAVFNLDAGRDVSVLLDARQGTKQADMVLLVPQSAFAGADGTDYVHLYSKFGGLFGCGGGI